LSMLSIIDRYLLREITLTFLGVMVVLLAMVLSHRLAVYLNLAVSGQLARDAILLLLGLQAIRFAALMVPLALLLAIMLALGRLHRDSEMVALAASGQGPWAVFRPVLLLAVPLAMAMSGLSLWVVPRVMALQQELQERAEQTAEVSIFTPGAFREVAGGRFVVYVGALAEEGRALRDIFVYSPSRAGLAITTAREGRQRIDPDTDARYVVLGEGRRYEGVPGQGDYQSMRFEELTVRVDRTGGPSEELRRQAIPLEQLVGSPVPAAWAEIQARIAVPVSLLLLAALAPLLARAPPRAGRYGRVVAAVLIYIIYMNLLEVGQAWLIKDALWWPIGLWWVHLLALILGVALWVRHYGVGRVSR